MSENKHPIVQWAIVVVSVAIGTASAVFGVMDYFHEQKVDRLNDQIQEINRDYESNRSRMAELAQLVEKLEFENGSLKAQIDTLRSKLTTSSSTNGANASSPEDSEKVRKQEENTGKVDITSSHSINSSSKVVMAGDYSVELSDCKRTGHLTYCEIIITNYGKYEETRIYRDALKGSSKALAPDGTFHDAFELFVGNKGGTAKYVKTDLPKGFGVNGKLSFTGYTHSKISLLDISIGSGVSVPNSAKFSDIPILQ